MPLLDCRACHNPFCCTYMVSVEHQEGALKGPRREGINFGNKVGNRRPEQPGDGEVLRARQDALATAEASAAVVQATAHTGHERKGWGSADTNGPLEHHWADDEGFEESFDSGGAWEGPNLLRHQYSDVSEGLLEQPIVIQELARRDEAEGHGSLPLEAALGDADDEVDGHVDPEGYNLNTDDSEMPILSTQVFDQLAAAADMAPEDLQDALEVVKYVSRESVLFLCFELMVVACAWLCQMSMHRGWYIACWSS